MIIREGRATDAEQIAAILNHYIRETTVSFKTREQTAADMARMIERNHAVFVAEQDGRVTGYATYFQFRNGPGYARTMEHSILLAPGSRGAGRGRALMRAIEDHATDAGAGSLWAGVSAENPEGVAFHEALGYEHVARLPKVGFKFGRWIDLYLMRKWLQPEGDAMDASD